MIIINRIIDTILFTIIIIFIVVHDLISRTVAMLQPLRLSGLEIQGSIRYSLQVTGIPCKRCVSHTGYLAHGNNMGGAKRRSRHNRNSKRVVRNPDERNVGTKGKSPKLGLISAKALTIQLPRDVRPPTIN